MATDGLGRSLPLGDEVGRTRANKFVGVFYFLTVFDVTNQVTYPPSWQALCRVFDRVKCEGNRVPQIAFLCPFGDPVHRDLRGWGKSLHYVNATGRNDIVAAKVSVDATAVSFYVRITGNEIELAIPRTVLGIADLPAAIDLKWADNIQQTGDWSDFTLNGASAPNDRHNYRAKFGTRAP